MSHQGHGTTDKNLEESKDSTSTIRSTPGVTVDNPTTNSTKNKTKQNKNKKRERGNPDAGLSPRKEIIKETVHDFIDPMTGLVEQVPGEAHQRVFYGTHRVVETPLIQRNPFSSTKNIGDNLPAFHPASTLPSSIEDETFDPGNRPTQNQKTEETTSIKYTTTEPSKAERENRKRSQEMSPEEQEDMENCPRRIRLRKVVPNIRPQHTFWSPTDELSDQEYIKLFLTENVDQKEFAQPTWFMMDADWLRYLEYCRLRSLDDTDEKLPGPACAVSFLAHPK